MGRARVENNLDVITIPTVQRIRELELVSMNSAMSCPRRGFIGNRARLARTAPELESDAFTNRAKTGSLGGMSEHSFQRERQ